MMVELTGFGFKEWVRVSKDIPPVEGADAVILQMRMAKTAKKKLAFVMYALLAVHVDGEQVWEGEAVDAPQGPADIDQDTPAVPDRPQGGKAAGRERAERATSGA